jgi:transposase
MPRKRRSFSAEFKAQVVLELISGKKSLMEASREYNIKDTVLSRWKQEFVGKASQVFEQPQEVQEKEARVAELERMVGKLTMQIELQKKVLNLADSLARDNER